MSETDVTAEIRAYLVTEYLAGEDSSDLTDDYDLISSGVIDSLGLVRMISHIAARYGVPVDDIEFGPDDFRTLTAITRLIHAHTPAEAA
ncbi:acyl carrier protein [Streptomyces sp. Je 1-79]|uniref:acyl carrier protein n=1 Tax=Streptomyces sp. Je 1-79 TaxID=2943847 RepID=UPI0021A90D3B|nr:acyl carrier protein [Streptomyces sp. Je 1-79]MCT4352598.1 acyl carrier protein [Streptomyces sp. Je 1-79]